jgi:hypothetical protein
MLTVECKLYHSKKETDKSRVAFDKAFDSSGKYVRSSTQPFIYRPQGHYNLFGATTEKTNSLVLLKDAVPGKTIEEYFGPTKKAKSLNKALDSFTRFYSLSRVYQPAEEYFELTQ